METFSTEKDFDNSLQLYKDKVVERGESIKAESDFKSWDHKDLSELFWIHLGKYVKEPNEHSLRLIELAWYWAVHDNKALSNSFSHALKWAGIDLFTEYVKHGWNQN